MTTSPTSAPRRARILLAGALALLTGVTGLVASPAAADTGQIPGTAGATTYTGVVEPTRPAFYEPPATLPGTPGRIIRTEPATNLLDPLHLSNLQYSATRVMYASKDRLGRPIAVTGLVLAPRAPWIGLSSRPLISYAPGTQGMGDRCAPSRQWSSGFEYEQIFIAGLLARGYVVAMTDYQGLGTPGTHTYMMRVPQAQAVLDMARAGRTVASLPASTPVGIMGYSQGGGAAAAAAELAAAYAPDLAVKGVLAGAPPADLGAVAKNLDGHLFAAFLAYSLPAMGAAYDAPVLARLTPAGATMLRGIEGSCVTDLATYAFQKSSNHEVTGRPVTDHFDTEPWKGILEDNRIGNRRPSMPVLISHSVLDDTIPYAVGRQLAKNWCAKGANVRLATSFGPTHLGGMFPSSAESFAFFEARFAGLPQFSGCWLIW